MAYVFYDFETTGRNAYHDQIIRFAALRADSDFQPLEHFEVSCRLLDSVVPCPAHMRSLLVPIAQLENPTLPTHYAMVREIQQRLSAWSPAVFLSKDAISFGELAFRQALYKTIHNPYLTNTNNNCRSDVTRLVQATFAHTPNAIAIPLSNDNRADFDLERVADANGFAATLPRGPMRAVHACLFLCRLIETRSPEIWSMFMRFAKKASVDNFVRSERIFALSDVYNSRAYRWLVTVLCENPDNPSEFLVYNLGVDPERLAMYSDAQLDFCISQQFPRPLRRLKSNGCPMLAYPDDFPFPLPDGVAMAEIESRAELLHSDSKLRERLTATFWALNPKPEPSEHVEHQIYDGFFQRPDEKRMAAFHDALTWSQRYMIANTFQDVRLRTLALRLIHAEDSSVMAGADRLTHDRELAHRVGGVDMGTPWRNLPWAIRELDKFSASANQQEATVLAGHRARMQARLDVARSILV